MYRIYHSRALPSKARDNCALFRVSLATFFAVHTESATNQNQSMSSSPAHLKVGNFKCATMSYSSKVLDEVFPLGGPEGGVAGGIYVVIPSNGL